ncbi:MAG TPA: DoxX family membrane protein [Natronosporangium sp.]|nr:DoxX family membrane protein [Natronosporangium sp.]
MDFLILIGRILFVLLFLISAMGHFRQADAMTAYAQSRGVPSPRASVLATGVIMVVGALLVLLGLWADLGALLLFLFLIGAAFFMHPFWKESDQQTRQMESLHFYKDISLAGASLALFGLFVKFGDDVGLTLTGPLFG